MLINKSNSTLIVHYFKVLAAIIPLTMVFKSMHAQVVSIHHPQLQFRFEDSLLRTSGHASFKPLEVQWTDVDRMLGIPPKASGKTNNPNFRVMPAAEMTLNYSKNNGFSLQRLGAGLYTSGIFGRKTGFELTALIRREDFRGRANYQDSLQLIYGYNHPLNDDSKNMLYGYIRGYAWWKPLQWLTFRIGNDKHFIGDGYRSLLLSENAAAYPFLETRLRVWKIQYTHQVNVLRDLIPGRNNERFTKYISRHMLAYNLSPRIHFYVYEAVIWRQTDSAKHYRGFDITYLNPFIFFRPAEFNIGSPDNALLGFGGRIKIMKHTYLYSQLLLDEFRMKELKANNGWWGNKYGYQLGFKTYGLFKQHASLLQLEYNHCRPFTYSHTLSMQNYGHLFMPLAHPQGSNFKELNGIFRMAIHKKWSVHLTGTYLEYGADPVGENYGGNIYKSQWSFSKYNGNFTGQGIAVKQITTNMVVSRIIAPAWRLQAFGEIHALVEKTAAATSFYPSVSIGVNTLLYE